MPSRSFDRAGALDRLRHDDFDVVVVGGGITGVGVALDAVTRGLRTALVERDDFASGTSSRSSKLVHGGLRYLDQREFRLVYEALAERQHIIENAPHLVSILPFLLPALAHEGRLTRRLAPIVSGALWMYDLTGGIRIGTRHQRVSVETAVAHIPTLDASRLRGSYVYFDAQADDARLTLTIARTAAAHGAAVVNRARVVSFEKHGRRVVGVRVAADHDEFTIRARSVVNAAGVWADDVRALDEGAHPASMQPAKGVHVTLPWSLVRNDIAAIIPVPGDTRSVFVIPWGDHTYVGTTDTEYDGSLDDPRCTPSDVEYLLGALNSISTFHASADDVVGTWAGLRPLLRGSMRARTADLSRRHAVRTSDAGVVTVTGGKLTTYRRMAADAVDAVQRDLPGSDAPSRTKHLRLVGADGIDPPHAALPPPGAHSQPSTAEHLAARYGSEMRTVQALAEATPAWAEPLVPGLPYLKAEAVYAVREEMASSLDDVLSRRTRSRVLDAAATAAAAGDVASLIAPELGWSSEEAAARAREFAELVVEDRP
ncbi:MAG TPA: glycerol-3-phosphate dehydrogenase/oxidase [Acidimicrobiia bacterium]|nr:glycerol-3-phosphate dehydrogenase/oxidase [Acidimicrobiia bacterium]